MNPASTLHPAGTSAATMTAALFSGPQTIRFEDVPVPEPAAHEVRVRIEGCGVCGSNLPVWEGRPWFDYPLEPGAPGHEAWGVVEAVGGEVDPFLIGAPVACLSWHGFAPYDVADAGAVVPLPDDLKGRPFPGEPLACAMNVFRRSRIAPGETVVVVGIGFLGALLVQLARSAGARVVAVSRRRFARRMAAECGADDVCDLADSESVLHAVRESEGADCVIEATGCQEALDLASGLVRVRGRLIVAGYHQDGPRTVNMQQWNWKGIDVINAHERDPDIYVDGMRRAVEAIRDRHLRIDPLLTHSFPFEEIGTAFETAARRPEGFLKSLVVFPGGVSRPFKGAASCEPDEEKKGCH